MQDLQRASGLFNEMVRRGVERNVHTYTALMNVCIKCQNCAKALETYNTMRQSGCFPNVVTYNTLIECAPTPSLDLCVRLADLHVGADCECLVGLAVLLVGCKPQRLRAGINRL